MGAISPLHIVFICVVALLVLGPRRLPEAGRSLGRGLREFRDGVAGRDEPAPAILSHGEEPPGSH